jgi:hypothetical protein
MLELDNENNLSEHVENMDKGVDFEHDDMVRAMGFSDLRSFNEFIAIEESTDRDLIIAHSMDFSDLVN